MQRKTIIHLLAITLVSLLVFSQTLFFDFALDDHQHITNNTLLNNSNNLPKLLLSPTWPGNLYRPLTTLSFFIDRQLESFTQTINIFHLSNVLLHTLCSILAYFLALKLTNGKTAFFTAIFFSLLPIHTEAIAGISNRNEILAAIFSFAAILSALAHKKLLPFLGVLIFSFLAISAKESAFCLPLLLFLVQFIVDRKNILPKLFTQLFAFCLAAGLYLSLRKIALGSYLLSDWPIFYVVNPLASLDWSERALFSSILFGRYLRLSLFPLSLSHDHSYSLINPTANYLASADFLCFLLGTIVLIYSLAKRKTIICFCALWFIFSLSIASNIPFPIGVAFAERLAYLASFSLCLTIALGITCPKNQTRYILRMKIPKFLGVSLSRISVSALISFFSYQTISYSTHWRDDASLHNYGLEVASKSAKAQQNYAILCLNEGRFDEAIAHLERAIDIYPPYADAAYRLHFAYLEKNQPSQAIESLERALRMDKKHFIAANALGWLFLNAGNKELAQAYFKYALEIKPDLAPALKGLYLSRF